MIQVKCSSCHAQFQVADGKAGQRDMCPKCGVAVEVPLTLAAPMTNNRPAPAPRPKISAGQLLKIEPARADDGEEIGLSDDPDQVASPDHSVTGAGLSVTTMQDAAIVDMTQMSILDAPVIEAIGSELSALIEQGTRRLVLDFDKVRFLSSQMLGVLVSLHKKACAVKGRLVLCSLRPDLMRVFTITRLEKILEIVENQARAKAVLGIDT